MMVQMSTIHEKNREHYNFFQYILDIVELTTVLYI